MSFKSNQRVIWNEITGDPEGNRIGTPGDLLYDSTTSTLWIKAFGRQSKTGWRRLAFGAAGGAAVLVAGTVQILNGIVTVLGALQGITSITADAAGVVALSLTTPRTTNQWSGVASLAIISGAPGSAHVVPAAGNSISINTFDETGAPINYLTDPRTFRLAVLINGEGQL